MLEAFKRSQNNSIEFIFVFLPSYETIDKGKISKSSQAILKVVNEQNIKSINFADYLLKEKNWKSNFPFDLPGHYNEIGYEKLAKYIIQQLQDS